MRSAEWTGLFAILPWLVLGGISAPASEFEFALIGDGPYTLEDGQGFERLRRRINEQELSFVLHVGDIKARSESCADDALQQRRDWFDRFAAPFILVPGDNDWTDCHRKGAGAWAPLDRLAALRRIFFNPPGRLLGRGRLDRETQAAVPGYGKYPEHVRWHMEGVWFVSLHVVGSQNGRQAFEGRTRADDLEVEERMTAALAWMRESFALAKAHDAPGFLVAIHANPRFEAQHDERFQAAYGRFLSALRDEVIAFDRPVVLVHVDSHYFRIDKPLTGARGRRLDYFTRVESFGSPHMHWIRVSVDPDDPLVFRFRQEIIEENAIRR